MTSYQTTTPTGRLAPPVAFDVVANGWLREVRANMSWTRYDVRTFERLTRLHLTPSFGNMPLHDATPSVIDDWIASMQIHNTLETTNNAYRVLKMILERAVDHGLIESNPCKVESLKPERAPRERPTRGLR